MFRSKILLGIFAAAFALLSFLAKPAYAQTPTPTPTSHFEFLSKPLDIAFDSAVSGNLAYVTAGEHIYVVDISIPESPNIIGNFYRPGCVFYAIDVYGASSYSDQAHFSCSPVGGIYVLNVSDLEHFDTQEPLVIPTQVGFYEMTVQDSYLYAAAGLEGLYIFDVIAPTDETEPIKFKPEENTFIVDVKVRGNVAYLADNNSKVWTVNITNKTQPSVMDSFELPGSATGVSILGDYAYISLQGYLSAGNGGLQVVNIADPYDIFPVAPTIPLPTPEGSWDVEVAGNYAFMNDDNGKLFAVDVSNPSEPSFVAEYQMESEWRLTVRGDLILASNGSAGLSIFRFTGLAPAAPTPFLDLPWDYEAKGMSFSQAATSINSYFDHEYPFLSASGLSEPFLVLTYEGFPKRDVSYTSHDGYDYGKRLAKVNLGDPVLAAADGCAYYTYTGGPSGKSAGGNEIRIVHDGVGADYQTRYLHLRSDRDQNVDGTYPFLLTRETNPDNCVDVSRGDQIGEVGFSGHVDPNGEAGSHLHFMVIHDENGDGDFDDNIPDGVVDPFGWQSTDLDPWPNYTFSYGGQQRTGSYSFYLWVNAIANLSPQLSSNGGYFELERYRLSFSSGATSQTLNLDMRISPVVRVTNTLESLGSSIRVTARDLFGNIVSSFLNFFTVSISFSGFDLSHYDLNTLSIYSSEDAVNWTPEDTTINFDNQVASTSVNHLSYFALIAERLDTISPTTNAALEGEEGDSNWFRSDVRLTLNAVDNEGGLGVDYTLFRINDEDWRLYISPVLFSQEGSYRIEFYSVDNDENIEEVKTIKFNIDKTPALVSLSVNPNILWPPDGKMIDVTVLGDASDNIQLKSVVFNVEDEYNEIEPIITGFNEIIKLKASRRGNDFDGRTYKILVKLVDIAGNVTETYLPVIVPHDQRTN